MAFYNPEADFSFIKSLEENLIQNENRKIIKLPYHINDVEFSNAILNAWNEYHENTKNDIKDADKKVIQNQYTNTNTNR
jgi:uncharacterized protein (UPF0261 family)